MEQAATHTDTSESKDGLFITFEGGDGSGKTTHINFLARALRDAGREVVCLREPGGTPVGEILRDVVLDPENTVCAEAELLIYEAARAQLVNEVIAPALVRGAIVLCDRFFDSTIAYQAYGRQLSREFVREANIFACQGVMPDRTLLIQTEEDVRVGLSRALKDRDGDRMERAGVAFHACVNQAFADIAAANPERVRTLRIQPTKGETARLVFLAVADLFRWNPDCLPFDDAFFEQANNISGETKASGGKI